MLGWAGLSCTLAKISGSVWERLSCLNSPMLCFQQAFWEQSLCFYCSSSQWLQLASFSEPSHVFALSAKEGLSLSTLRPSQGPEMRPFLRQASLLFCTHKRTHKQMHTHKHFLIILSWIPEKRVYIKTQRTEVLLFYHFFLFKLDVIKPMEGIKKNYAISLWRYILYLWCAKHIS